MMVDVTIWKMLLRRERFLPRYSDREDLDFVPVPRPMPELNRFFYTTVGGSWYWVDRLPWTYLQWKQYLEKPGMQTHLLTVGGVPAGFAEIELALLSAGASHSGATGSASASASGGREPPVSSNDKALAEPVAPTFTAPAPLEESGGSRPPLADPVHSDSARLVYFGLLPEYTGMGLGGDFLSHCAQYCFESGCEAVTLETCSTDHPNARAHYGARGFELVSTRTHRRELPDRPPGPWPGAGPISE